MAEEEAAEVEAVSEGGSGYALMTDAWPSCAKVSSRIIRGIHRTPKCEIVWELSNWLMESNLMDLSARGWVSCSLAGGHLETCLSHAQEHLAGLALLTWRFDQYNEK